MKKNIKHFSKKLVLIIFKSLNVFINYNTFDNIRYIKGRIFSFWLRFSFKECSSSSFSRPIFIKGSKYITIGENFSVGKNFTIEAWDKHNGNTYRPCIIIGRNVSFNYGCHISSINRIVIHNNVLFGCNVFITDHSHGDCSKEMLEISPSKRNLFSKGPVIIEDNVWIGRNVCIFSGVTIKNNSIIGANSVVTKDIPQNVIAAGNPAVIVKELGPSDKQILSEAAHLKNYIV